MNFYINTDMVLAELNQIDKCIDELRTICSNMESNISSGWDSDRAKNMVTPTIDGVKDSITQMQASVMNVRDNVKQYVTNVQSADTAGSIGNNNSVNSNVGGTGLNQGNVTNMMK